MFFFKNFKTIIFIIVLFAAIIIALSYNVKQKSPVGLVTKIVLAVAAPLQTVLNVAVNGVSDAWSRYLLLVKIGEENKNLRKTIDDLKSQLVLYQEGYLEAQRLRNLLALKDDHDFDLVTARVIGRGQTSFSKTILINKGTAHGLDAGQPVMAGPGLEGRVINASWRTAKVLPLIDESSNIDAVVQRNRTQGIVRGAGSRGCLLKYISKAQDVTEGDTIVSSGMGGIFPKGLMIGKVTHVNKQETGLFLKIYVAPSVDFSNVEEVVVLTFNNDEEKGKKK